MMQGLLTDAPEIRANDMVLAKNMAEKLHQLYPDHLWAVHVDSLGGIADVRHMALAGNMGFRIKLPAVYSASELDRHVMRAGGEILERYRLKRARANAEEINHMARDKFGRKLHD